MENQGDWVHAGLIGISNNANARQRFLPARRYMLARVIGIATCLSVCPSVCHAPVLCQNEES